MRPRYEPVVNEPILLMRRLAARESRDFAMECGLPDLAKQWRKTYDDLGKQIRKMLRVRGYQRDCEIDAQMENLARDLLSAHEKLALYIFKNSPRDADEMAELGLTSLQKWQDKNPSPIRPIRR